MQYISTAQKADPVSFGEAALQGLAPDGGLYLPEHWPQLPDSFWHQIREQSLQDIGFELSRFFVDSLNTNQLKDTIHNALNFDAPLIQISNEVYVLELFHGPTLAFKDFGARFMSRTFSALQQEREQDLVILAATSGDTGSAVAQGFLGVEGIKVCLLYPSGKVSRIQEQQLTTAGKNVTALEVEGTFDDCQRIVKQAFSDSELNEHLLLSSANSINIARLIPQMFYYGYAVAQCNAELDPVFSVPSGNFGNLTAGLMAQKIGMPASGFIAATNRNNVVPKYLKTGEFNPSPSVRTISNAMDVGNPSNFARILHLFDHDHKTIRQQIWSRSFSDEETRQAIKQVLREYDYLMDPHTAIGFLAVQKYDRSAAGYFEEDESAPKIILSTAHPSKFRDVIELVIKEEVPMPERLRACFDKEKQSVPISSDYQILKQWLLDSYS